MTNKEPLHRGEGFQALAGGLLLLATISLVAILVMAIVSAVPIWIAVLPAGLVVLAIWAGVHGDRLHRKSHTPVVDPQRVVIVAGSYAVGRSIADRVGVNLGSPDVHLVSLPESIHGLHWDVGYIDEQVAQEGRDLWSAYFAAAARQSPEPTTHVIWL